MLVRDRMTMAPTTILDTTSLKDALELISSQNFRHLPVVNSEGKLVGITTEKSLVYSSPSPNLSLNVFEIDHLLSNMSVGQIMKREVLTIPPDLPLEEAARVMVDHQIGCLPVVENDELVGIISDTDIFRVFVEGLGGGHPSLRITITVPEEVGSLARVARFIAERGWNVYSLGIFWGKDHKDRILAFRVENVDKETLVKALEAEGIQIRHVWEPTLP